MVVDYCAAFLRGSGSRLGFIYYRIGDVVGGLDKSLHPPTVEAQNNSLQGRRRVEFAAAGQSSNALRV